jgi:uncharacterized DUF497 family protein
MRFEWDPEKNRANYRKHGIRFEPRVNAKHTREVCYERRV